MRPSHTLPLSPPLVLAQVWNSVDTYAKKQCTSIIHGKYSHEETVATASFAQDYLIVKDLNEAQVRFELNLSYINSMLPTVF